MRKETYLNANDVAQKAADHAIELLARTIQLEGRAVWALAGGSSPMLAYRTIAAQYAEALDWSKVIVLIGDERCVPHNHPDSNWGQIEQVLFSNGLIDRCKKLIPRAELGPDKGAAAYSATLLQNITDGHDGLTIDLLWLGVGEDGHTLSLFPGHPGLEDRSRPVIPIYDSPKPPPDRISLSLDSASKAKEVVIFAVGAAKREALHKLNQDIESLPVGKVAESARKNGSEVLWLFDEAAGERG